LDISRFFVDLHYLVHLVVYVFIKELSYWWVVPMA